MRGRCDQTNHRGIIKALARELSGPRARLGLCGDDLAVRGEEIAVSNVQQVVVGGGEVNYTKFTRKSQVESRHESCDENNVITHSALSC